MKREKLSGQSLWEVIIALSIAGLIALGLVRATGSSVKSTRFSSDQSWLTAKAQEKIAQIIDKKNKDPKAFWGGDYFPTEFDTEELGEDYCLLTKAVNENGDEVKITVDVFWEKIKGGGKQCGGYDFNHMLKFETNVTRY